MDGTAIDPKKGGQVEDRKTVRAVFGFTVLELDNGSVVLAKTTVDGTELDFDFNDVRTMKRARRDCLELAFDMQSSISLVDVVNKFREKQGKETGIVTRDGKPILRKVDRV